MTGSQDDNVSHNTATMEATKAHLSHTPWCRDLLESPDWTPTRTESRVPKSSSEDSFFAETLGTRRTIRHCLTLRPTKLDEEVSEDEPGIREVRTIMELGNGLNGHPRIAHGGFVATMLDEVCGVLITLNMEIRMRKMGNGEYLSGFTAYLNTNYKKPVPTPGIVLCTATFAKKEGKKIWVKGTVEDGQGTVYTTGEGMFIEIRRAKL